MPVLASLALLIVGALGCGEGAGHTKGRAKAELTGHTKVPAEAKLAGSWEGDGGQVTAFLRPAYEAMGEDLGGLAGFSCNPSVAAYGDTADVSTGRRFQCTVVFASGLTGNRRVTFDAEGRVADEVDVPTNKTVNPGVGCSNTGESATGEYMPTCDEVRVQVAQDPLPAADSSLYGTASADSAEQTEPSSSTASSQTDEASMPNDAEEGNLADEPADTGETAAEGKPGNPAECGEVNGELVQATLVDCDAARGVADDVTDAAQCAPAAGGDDSACDIPDWHCRMSANVDPENPWAVACSTEGNPYTTTGKSVTFYVPAAG